MFFTDGTDSVESRRCDFPNGVAVLVDSISSEYLDGATIDFRDTGEVTGFIITNTQCGGQEFPTEPSG
jgi:Fe-S cluster assembly iron-binding protein IscA